MTPVWGTNEKGVVMRNRTHGRVGLSIVVIIGLVLSLSTQTVVAHETTASEALKGRAYDGQVLDPSPGGVPLDAIRDARCKGGMAADLFPCHKVDLDAFLPLTDLGATFMNDVWGWEDSVTGMQIAIAGVVEGTVFVDVTDGINPVYLGTLPTPPEAVTGPDEFPGNIWGDIRVYENTAYIGSEAADIDGFFETGELIGFGVQIVDLTQFRGQTGPFEITETNRMLDITQSHNLSLNEDTGRLYVAGSFFNGTPCALEGPFSSGGSVVYDLTDDPLEPKFIGCLDQEAYNHDVQCVVYDGPDADYRGREICVGSNEANMRIYDATDINDVQVLATLSYQDVPFFPPPDDAAIPFAPAYYTHQGWFSEDHTFFFLGDELDELQLGFDRTTYIWDMTDLDNVELIADFSEGETSIDHNMFVLEGLLYQANYSAGLTIYDAWKADKGRLTQRGFFDTFPADDRTDFFGAWGTYPFFGDGKVIVTSSEEGMFVLNSRAKSSNNQFAPGRR